MRAAGADCPRRVDVLVRTQPRGNDQFAVDLRSKRAQELLTELIGITGTFLTNFPARGWMSYSALQKRRADLVMLALTGNRDGSTALDYTVTQRWVIRW